MLTNKNKMYMENLLSEYPEDLMEDLYTYQLKSPNEIAKELNITLHAVMKLINYYRLTRNEQKFMSRVNTIHKRSNIEKAKQEISRESIVEYYLNQSHTYVETMKHFNVSEYIFMKLLRDYDIEKDHSVAAKERQLRKQIREG